VEEGDGANSTTMTFHILLAANLHTVCVSYVDVPSGMMYKAVEHVYLAELLFLTFLADLL